MGTVKHLSKAPITEALIDFRARLPEPLNEQHLIKLKENLDPTFPIHDERRHVQASVDLQGTEQITQRPIDQGLYGWFFRSQDELNIAQFRNNGFTFSRLKPYTNWEDFFKAGRDLWELYEGLVRPVSVPRIAVRYIKPSEDPLADSGDLRIPHGAAKHPSWAHSVGWQLSFTRAHSRTWKG